MNLQVFRKTTDYQWELPVTYREDMRVPIRVFATRKLLESALGDLSFIQAVNAATLPGLVGQVMIMPDVHQGYGFPIGGVAASRVLDGVISPGAIGYDINCGVRMLASTIRLEEVRQYIPALASALDRHCPSGVGVKGGLDLTGRDLDQACQQGVRWAYKRGLASEEDIRFTEENGCLEGADPKNVSLRAKERGRTQLGTLGAGNHFLEVDVVEQTFDNKSADAMGLHEGCLVLSIHCGSRGFGHQICTDYVQEFQTAVRRYGIRLPDRELVCVPINSPEGQAYLGAMRCAANYAFLNRQLLASQAREAFEEVLAGKVKNCHLRQIYDIAHNMGKIETHQVDGKTIKVCIHRKGATRAFGPGTPGLPIEYMTTGQPVLVPGSMGTASWVLSGTEMSMDIAFGSCCHGAGRMMSRSEAKRRVQGEKLKKDLENQGIQLRAGSLPGLAEEAPQAYKDVDAVVETVCGAGIARKVARLRPVLVVKG